MHCMPVLVLNEIEFHWLGKSTLLLLLTAAIGPRLAAEYGLNVCPLLPGYRAYCLSLADGLTPRV